MKFLAYLAAAILPATAVAKTVIAHVVVGVTLSSYTIEKWEADIDLARSFGIDAFALNIATPFDGDGGCATQVSYAMEAAGRKGFKAYFMFDYDGGTAGPWAASEIGRILDAYKGHGAFLTRDGKTIVGTFSGADHIGDWPGIKAGRNLFFIPSMMGLGQQGVTNNLGTIDGFFSWDAWPDGPQDINTNADTEWNRSLQGRPYMMPVSPWFFTRLPNWHKAWTWRGESAWHQRWQQVSSFAPEYVQIITWNDWGESHYLRPIDTPGIPSGAGQDAVSYVQNMPHEGWLQVLPYYINQYKTGSTAVTTEKLVYWYRLTPAAAGSDGGVTGNHCKTDINIYGYQTCYAPSALNRDKIFVTALVKSLPATVTIQVGSNPAVSYQATSTGAFHVSQDFNGQLGVVKFTLSHNGAVALTGNGAAIQASPAGGITNYNAWVGSA